MKLWLQILLELSKWKEDDPSAPELARMLKRDPRAVWGDLQMMRRTGFVKRLEAEPGHTKGLIYRWRITETGLKRLKMAGLL